MPKDTAPLPDWGLVLSSAARLQRVLPDAVLVGGTASAIHAEHRFSRDADHMGEEGVVHALQTFDKLYPQANGESPLQQLQVQLANAVPYDLDGISPDLTEYKNLAARWHDWSTVKEACARLSTVIFDRVCDLED